MRRIAARWARVRHDDSGMSLVLVVGMVGIISLMAVTTATIANDGLRSSRHHTEFESSLAAAEAGVDSMLSAISIANAAAPGVAYTMPSPCTVTAPSATDLASVANERAWARDTLLALAAAEPTCVRRTSGGDYVAVRPPGKQAVYSMGFFPRYSTSATRRLIKAEYVFAPFAPGNAVLTGGNLDFSGSVAVNSLVSTTPSNVHSNANIAISGSGSLSVAGAMSASGTLPATCGPPGVTGGCTAAAPYQVIPTISARAYWVSESAAYAASWFDLCPDGSVKRPTTTAPVEPCSTSATTVGGSGYNGWVYTAGSGTTPPKWTLPRTAGGPFPGIYYVYQGDAEIGDNGNSSATWQISVLAEAQTGVTNPATCDKLGGNIRWKLFNMTPRLPGLQLLADANLTGDANASAGSGLFYAGDKIDLQTSSATMTGAVIAANACAAQGNNNIQGVTIRYDDTLELAVHDVIRTALWLEYPSG